MMMQNVFHLQNFSSEDEIKSEMKQNLKRTSAIKFPFPTAVDAARAAIIQW